MTQTEMILKHLESGRSITGLDALRLYGCLRLGARIWDLRQQGKAIDARMVERNGKHVAEYRIYSGKREVSKVGSD